MHFILGIINMSLGCVHCS